MSLAKHVSIFFKADTKGFQSGLDKMSKSMARFGRQTQKLGKSITRNFSVPFALAGGSAVKMAADFDTSLTKIRTLVGASESQVNQFKESVLELSGTTAQAPKELADGLFFLTSAGLKGANAMETLEQVSKGVAIGLGEQTDLAKVAGAAQNAYGQDVLSASDALDVFGKMVKTGMFESSELAKVLGKEAGFAASLGISFEELGAFISTYTRTTGDATSATVGISGVMMAFTKETKKGEDALAKIGMSYGSLREMLGEQGLQKTLIHLKTAFENNGVELSEFFSKSQSLKGVINVLGSQTGEYINILDDLKKSTGFVNDGFAIVEETVGFKLQKAFNEFKLAMMDLGVALLPVANKVIDFVTKLTSAFKSLSPQAKESIATIAAGFAASGPLMVGFGLVLTSISKIQKALLLLSRSPHLLALTAAIAGVSLVVKKLRGDFDDTVDSLTEIQSEVNKTVGEFDALVSIASDETLALETRQRAIDKLNKSVTTFNGGLNTQNINLKKSQDLLKKERKELVANLSVRAGQEKLEKLFQKRFEEQLKLSEKIEPTSFEIFNLGIGSKDRAIRILTERRDKQVKENIAALDDEVKKVQELVDEYVTLFNVTTGGGETTGGDGTTTSTVTSGGGGGGGYEPPKDNRTEEQIIKDMYPFLDEQAIRESLGAVKLVFNEGRAEIEDTFGGEKLSEFEQIKKMYPFLDDQAIRESLGSVVLTFNEGAEQIEETFTGMSENMMEMLTNIAENISSGIGDAFASAVIEGENFGEAMLNVFKQMLKQLIASIVQAMILKAIFQAFPGVEAAMAIAGKITGVTKANDIAFGPSAGRFITGPEGTFSLNPNDSIVAGTNLFGGNQGNNNMTVNGYIDGSSIFLSNTRQTNTVNRLS